MRNDRDFLVINNRNLMDFGVYLFGEIPHVMPKRDIEEVVIPGRNGSLTIDNGRWNNVKITYQMVMLGDGDKRIDDLMGFLISLIGSVKIEDSREPDYYRIGRLVELPDWKAAREAGTLKLSFDCRPEKWLTDNPLIDIMSERDPEGVVTLYNPTKYDAKPLFRVKAIAAQDQAVDSSIWIDGYIRDENSNQGKTLASNVIDVKTAQEIWIDCESGESYDSNISYNSYVGFRQGTSIAHTPYPVLVGNTEWVQNPLLSYEPIKINTKTYAKVRVLTGTFSKVEMYPRWWTL